MRTYKAAILDIPCHSKPLLYNDWRIKFRLRMLYLMCTLSRSCEASYIRKTTRCFSQLVREEHTARISTGWRKAITNDVVPPLIDSNNFVNARNVLNPIYWIPLRYPRSIEYNLVSSAEAVAVLLQNPSICSQKRFVQVFDLPWSACRGE